MKSDLLQVNLNNRGQSSEKLGCHFLFWTKYKQVYGQREIHS